MPVDISASFTPTFDASAPVPADAEYANHAALANMVRPAFNRTEYLKQILEGAPWVKSGFFEDFLNPTLSVGNSRIWDGHWLVESTTLSYSHISGAGSSDEAGVVLIQNSTGGAITSAARKAEGIIRAEAFRRLVCRVRIFDVGAGMGFHLGLAFNGGVSVINLSFLQSQSANWQLRTNADNDLVDTSEVAVAGSFHLLDLRHDGAGNWTGSVDGSTPVAPGPDVPSLNDVCTPEFVFTTPAAGASRAVNLDFIYFELATPGRV